MANRTAEKLQRLAEDDRYRTFSQGQIDAVAQRCPRCGRRVLLPCLACRIEAEKEADRVIRRQLHKLGVN